VKDFGGNVIAANLVPAAFSEEAAINAERARDSGTSNYRVAANPGQMGGYVTDPSGAVVPNARITVTNIVNGSAQTALTDGQGHWLLGGMGSGIFKAKVEMPGFRTTILNLNYDANQPSMYNFSLNVASVAETVEVTASAPQIDIESGTNAFHGNAWTYSTNGSAGGSVGGPISGRDITSLATLSSGVANQNASINVMNLQKRVAGVLPVAVDVPRTGTSFSFVRPLVLDEETKVTFSYKTR
jgi:hypothetical protein